MADRNRLRNFQVQEFFRSLENILLLPFDYTQASFDSAEFRTRRLDELERTLSVLLQRISQAYPEEHELLVDLTTLLNIVQEQRQHFQSLSFRNVLEQENPNAQTFMIGLARSGVGRPRYVITQDILQALHVGAGFRWADIARNLGVSERTLMRRRHEYQMFDAGHENFSALTNQQLDQLIREILHITPGIGYRLMQGALRQRGLRLQRRRILQSMQRVDPITTTLRASRTIIRRQYSVPCPNALWYIYILLFLTAIVNSLFLCF